MKKTLKYISAFIASALVTLPLCSCEKIDSMRARQIFKNTSGDELFYNGNTYNFMLYDSDDSYRLISSVYEMGMYRDETMQITDADVPVLLIDEFGKSATISANNNIPRIKGIIEKICKTYGEKIIFEGKEYYTFPTPDELSKAEVVDLRKLGLGFRDTRVYETTRKIVNKDVDLQKLHENNDTNCVREVLLTLPGVGPKVADCILLFSTLKRLEAFPIDVWVRRVINELYIKNENEEKVNKKEIEQIAKAKYGNLAGIAQQYLFYWKREA